MNLSRAQLVWLCCLGVGCGYLPVTSPDAGLLQVPGSYHQARMTPGHREHLLLKGEHQVRCHDCHDLNDGGFAAPAPEVCAQCHKQESNHHHPFDAGTPMGCLSCHVFRAREATARFEKWGCLSCHAEGKGDAGVVQVHVERCASCHRPHQEPFTQAADCTTCHEVTLQHGAKGETVAETCMNCHPHHTPAVAASQQCLDCHSKPTMEAKSRVVPEALFSPGHPGCGSCHQAHTFKKGAVKSCAQCHQDKPVLALQSHTQCIDCHRPHSNHASPRDCRSCHEKEVVKHPADAQGQRCIGCHPVHAETSEAQLARPCVDCHSEPPFRAEVVHAVTTDCDDCHQPHAAKPRREALCVTCHEAQVAAVKKNRGHAKCEDCHAGLPHGEASTPKPCLSCHEKSQPPQAGHRECESCHASHSATVMKQCGDCHQRASGPALPGLHAEKKHQECKQCHAPHRPEPGVGPDTCKSCHRRLSLKEHPTAPSQCVGCHLFKQGSPDLEP